MKQFSYVILGILITTLIVNIRKCHAHDLLVKAPYMMTSMAQLVDTVHYARTVCDDVVLRCEEFYFIKEYDARVDMCIRYIMQTLSEIFSCRRTCKDGYTNDWMYVEAIVHSMIADLNETEMSASQRKTLSFMGMLCKALLFHAAKESLA